MFFGVPMPTLGQSLPGLQGAEAGQRLAGQYFQNRARAYNNKMLPAMSKALLAQRQAQAQQSQYDADHAPDLLALRQAQLEIARRNVDARRDYNLLQRDKLPAQNLRASNTAMNNPAVQQAASMNPDLARDYLGLTGGVLSKGLQNLGASGGAYNPLSYGAPSLQGVIGQPQPQPQGGFENPEALSIDVDGGQQIPEEGAHGRDNFMKAVQQKFADSAAKKTSTAAILNQRHYYENVLATLDGAKEDMVTAAKAYSGLGGQRRLARDIAAAATGRPTTPELKAYNNIKSVVSTLLSGETTRALGESHSDSVNHAMQVLSNPITWNKSPDLALSQVNALYGNIRNLAKQASHSTSETQANLAALDPNGAPLISDAPMGRSDDPTPLRPVEQPKSGHVVMVSPEGKHYEIPESDAQEAMKAGYKRAD